MNITKFDIGVFLSMSIVIIFMSFTFPAMGLAGNETETSDIPEFNLSQNSFDFTNEFPERPNAPSQGTLNHSSENEFDRGQGSVQVNLGESGSGDGEIFLAASDIDELTISNASEISQHTFTAIDETHEFEFDGYTINTIARNLTTGLFEWQLTQRPGSGGGWLDAIPVVGGIFGAAGDLLDGVLWIGSIILFGVLAVFELIVAYLTILSQVVIFIVSLFIWLSSTYSNIITNAPTGFINVILILPALLLFVELAKMTIVFISVIR